MFMYESCIFPCLSEILVFIQKCTLLNPDGKSDIYKSEEENTESHMGAHMGR